MESKEIYAAFGMRPCSLAMEFMRKQDSLEQAWDKCVRGDWLVWALIYGHAYRDKGYNEPIEDLMKYLYSKLLEYGPEGNEEHVYVKEWKRRIANKKFSLSSLYSLISDVFVLVFDHKDQSTDFVLIDVGTWLKDIYDNPWKTD